MIFKPSSDGVLFVSVREVGFGTGDRRDPTEYPQFLRQDGQMFRWNDFGRTVIFLGGLGAYVKEKDK